jgi:crotonobetainyl-CoA:carnitine CoA-transferase CaiB-like acyl-CoA transferase
MAKAGITGVCPPPMPEHGMGKDAGWAIYKIFITADQKQVFIAVTSDAHWERFCKDFGLHDLWEDVSLRTNEGRLKQHALLNERVKKVVSELTRDALVDRLEKIKVPHSIVNTPQDLLQDPHLRAIGHLHRITGPKGDVTELPALPMIFSSWPGPVRTNPPQLAEHSVEIMRDLGYTSDEIEAYINGDIIGTTMS